MIKKEIIVPMYSDWANLDAQKKDLSATIGDSQKAFAKEHDLDLKAVKADYKKFLAYQEDKKKFLDTDSETDALTQIWCVELQSEPEVQ